MTHPNALSARVANANAANARANQLYPQLVEVFSPYVGAKILKIDGSLLQKIQKQISELGMDDPGRNINVYHDRQRYGLSFVVKIHNDYESGSGDYQLACYHESSVYVGNLDGGVLTEIREHTPYRTDYTVADILAKREAFRKAQTAADNARSALYPFGENDR